MSEIGLNGQPFLYPNVSSVPGQKPGEAGRKPNAAETQVEADLFQKELDQALGVGGGVQAETLKFSNHATARMKERKIQFSPEMMKRVSDAIDRAAAKGVEDTLILTKDAALIVNVKNRTVVTAVDPGSLKDNVFTHIDGAVIVS